MKTTPRRGRRLPLEGTAKHQRELGLKPHPSPSRHRRGGRRDQAQGFGPRTGAAVLAIHSHIRGTRGGPVSGPSSSGADSSSTTVLAVHQSLSGTGRQKKTGTSKIMGPLGQGAPGFDKIAQAARGQWGRRRHIRFLLVAALMRTPCLLRLRGIMRSILLRKASSITDGPKQKHDGGEGSHRSDYGPGFAIRQWSRNRPP